MMSFDYINENDDENNNENEFVFIDDAFDEGKSAFAFSNISVFSTFFISFALFAFTAFRKRRRRQSPKIFQDEEIFSFVFVISRRRRLTIRSEQSMIFNTAIVNSFFQMKAEFSKREHKIIKNREKIMKNMSADEF